MTNSQRFEFPKKLAFQRHQVISLKYDSQKIKQSATTSKHIPGISAAIYIDIIKRNSV